MAVVAQIDGWDPVTQATVTITAASHDDVAVCHLGGGTWWPALVKLPTLRYDLFDGAFAGKIVAPSSSLTMRTEPWPDFGRYSLAGARIRLWVGEVGAAWETWVLRFDGRLSGQPAIADGLASVEFAVDDSWLDTALLATYAGTTGAEGPAALKGQAKPLAIGRPRYVAGTLIDSVNSVFQVSNGPVAAIEAALEKLARFGDPVADYATYDQLVAATIAPGAWATARAVGMARFGAPPAGQISFLVSGDNVAGWVRLPGAVIRRLATIAGAAGRIADATLTALDTARPYPVSIYLEQQTTAREIIQAIAASVNAVVGVSWTGQLFALPVAIGAATMTLAADGSQLPPVEKVEQVEIATPWQKLTLAAERAWSVHALADIAFTATLVDRGRYSATETYREGNIVDLADGSRWAFIATAPAAGQVPAAGSTYWSNINPATKAADIAFANGQSVESLKPAEPGATNSADPASAFGPGKTVGQAIESIARIEPIALDLTSAKADLAAVKVAGIDQAAIQRQASDALARIGETLARLTIEQNGVRTTMRDAGIRIDPDTKQIRIYGVDQIADRTSKVEIGLDAAVAQIQLRATNDYVNQQIALAQLTPGQAADLAAILRRVTAVEVSLDGLNATVALKADATTVTTLSSTITGVSQTLDALAGIVRTKADSTTVDALGIRTSSVEQTIQALGPVSGITMTIRQAQLAGDKAGEAALRDVLSADAATQRQIRAAAEVQQQLYTKILDDGAVEAMARLTLAARVGAAEAGLVEERLTRADAVSSQAQRIDLVTATFTKADSDEAAARLAGDKANSDATASLTATVATVSKAVADGDRAQAERTDLLTATVTKNRTDLAQANADEAAARIAGDKANGDALGSLSATVASQAQAIVDGDRAQATRTDQLVATATQAQIDGDASEAAARVAGDKANSDALGTLSATVTSQGQAIADGDRAQATRTDQLIATATQARIDGDANEAAARVAGDKANSDALASLSATVTTQGKAIADGDSANASLITQVGARLNAFGGTAGVTIEQKFSALVDRTGKLEGSYTLAITSGNRLQGFVLAGSSAAPARLMFVDTDLAIGTGRIISDTGTVMKVQGVGFGVAKDLVSWFGPSMDIAKCSRANGITWEATNGEAYFGGGLSVGTLKNGMSSSSLAADAVAEVPLFGSNGRPVRYIASWSYRREWTKTYASNSDGRRDFDADARAFAATTQDGGDVYGTITRQQSASTITLSRAFAGGYEQLQQASYQTQTLTMFGIPPVPGDAAGQATFTSTIGGGFTVLDPQQSAFNRTLRLSLARGFTNTESGVVQRLTIVAIEE